MKTEHPFAVRKPLSKTHMNQLARDFAHVLGFARTRYPYDPAVRAALARCEATTDLRALRVLLEVIDREHILNRRTCAALYRLDSALESEEVRRAFLASFRAA
jgi:hypothetical protein